MLESRIKLLEKELDINYAKYLILIEKEKDCFKPSKYKGVREVISDKYYSITKEVIKIKEKLNKSLLLLIQLRVEKELGRELDDLDKWRVKDYVTGMVSTLIKNFKEIRYDTLGFIWDVSEEIEMFKLSNKILFIEQLKNRNIKDLNEEELKVLLNDIDTKIYKIKDGCYNGTIRYYGLKWNDFANMNEDYFNTVKVDNVCICQLFKQEFNIGYDDIDKMLHLGDFVLFYNMCISSVSHRKRRDLYV